MNQSSLERRRVAKMLQRRNALGSILAFAVVLVLPFVLMGNYKAALFTLLLGTAYFAMCPTNTIPSPQQIDEHIRTSSHMSMNRVGRSI